MRFMRHVTTLLATALLLAGAHEVHAQRADSAAYIIRFGTDTLAMERWVRTADGLQAVSVTRSPLTRVSRYGVRFGADGRVTHSLTEQGASPVTPPGAIPTAAGFYAPQALALAQAARARDTLVTVPMLSGSNVQELRARRIGSDVFELMNPAGAITARARLTSDGRLLFLEAGSTTVERVAWFDIDAWAAEFAARDARGQAFGPLSSRDTARVRVGAASITIDYGQPSARGRTIFGGLVPYGRIWRAGANDATRLIIDRPVRIGDVRLEPGTFSLHVIPQRDRWELGVNRSTDMAAAMTPDPAQDVGRATMTVRTLADHVERFTVRLEATPNGALLRMQWENTEAAVPIVIER